MSTQVQENSFRTLGLNDNWIGYGNGNSTSALQAVPAIVSSPSTDGFSSAYPPVSSGGTDQSQSGLMAQMMQMLQSMMGMLSQFLGSGTGSIGNFLGGTGSIGNFLGGTGSTGGNGFGGTCSGAGNGSGAGQTTFGNATISSTGDPHLSVNGTLGDGSNVSMNYDNMQSDANLVSSNSFLGGYQVSTQTTAPDANGVTYNQSATVATDYGQTQVSFDNNGNATILENGSPVSIGYGQTVSLGNGETVTDNGNSLAIADTAQNGGNVTTTMTRNGNGVDVSVNAQNVALGGDAVSKALGKAGTSRHS